ncbi:MAG: isochorismatase family protein [Actinomycetales bacterium]|nr:isochorismatase family protein [Actinomycetales bacterium]
MSTIPGRDGRALLVIDVQNEVVDQTYDRDRVVSTIAGLVDGARDAGMPVVWVQHQDDYLVPESEGWQIVPALNPAEGEPRIRKQYRSSFEETDLEETLAALNAGTLVLCGAESNHCVRYTMHAALERGYDVLLVEDAHTAWDGSFDGVRVDGQAIIEEQNKSARQHRLPGRGSDTVTAAELLADLRR